MTRIPADLLRADVTVCFGEDLEDWVRVVGSPPMHSYRSVHATLTDDRLHVLAPWGSAAVEAVLWELTSRPGMERCVLWGTAGLLPGHTGPAGAVVVSAATTLATATWPDGTRGVARWPDDPESQGQDRHGLGAVGPGVDGPQGVVAGAVVSTDRFYGSGPAADEARYGDPSAWHRLHHADADAVLIDMETAPFYLLLDRFAPQVHRIAVRAAANLVEDVAALPSGAPDALATAWRTVCALLDRVSSKP